MWKKNSKLMIIVAVLVLVLLALYKIGNGYGIEKQKKTQTKLLENSKRVDHLKEACHKYNLNETNQLKTLNFRNVLIDRKYKFLYCNIPKVSLFQYST